MRFARGDVILRKGEFALAWNTRSPQFMRVFPITDAQEGYNPGDVVITSWQDFYRVSGIPAVAVRVTAGRMVAPVGWLKLPDLAFTALDMTSVSLAIAGMVGVVGVQHEWPHCGSDAEHKAPIFAS